MQSKFRAALHESIPEAVTSKRQPTADEILQTKNPYVDATLEELLRHSMTLPGTNRITTRDTIILGHAVPKDTDVYIVGSSADFFSPGFHVADSKRSDTSRAARRDNRAYGTWDPTDMKELKPERWLTTDPKGEVVFDKMAGLHLTFGLGQRGCWGRKIAQLQFKIIMALLVWNFKFLPVEGDLVDDSYVDQITRVPKKCFVNVEAL